MSTALHQDPAWRRRGIGASEVAAAIGLDPRTSPLDLWLLKTGRTEQPPPNEAQAWGRIVEASILDYSREREGVEYLPHPGSVQVEGPVWATPDALTREATVEAKNTRSSTGWGDPAEPSPVIPLRVNVQAQLQAQACEREEIIVLACILGAAPRVYRLHRDAEAVERIIEGALAFWRLVESDTPPEPRSGEDAERLARALSPRDSGPEPLALVGELESRALELRQAQAVCKQAEDGVAWARSRVMRLIGDAPGAEGPVGRISWKANKNGSRIFRATWNEE